MFEESQNGYCFRGLDRREGKCFYCALNFFILRWKEWNEKPLYTLSLYVLFMSNHINIIL